MRIPDLRYLYTFVPEGQKYLGGVEVVKIPCLHRFQQVVDTAHHAASERVEELQNCDPIATVLGYR